MSAGWAHGSTHRWRQLRAAILQRDGYRCHICGHTGADSVDHLRPVAHHGTDHPSNLAAAHRHCNESRGDQLIAPLTSRRW